MPVGGWRDDHRDAAEAIAVQVFDELRGIIRDVVGFMPVNQYERAALIAPAWLCP
ncbi:MAG TPA: hypothetical protein VFZ66_23790 [Herpetosiphonaceae bacterium]